MHMSTYDAPPAHLPLHGARHLAPHRHSVTTHGREPRKEAQEHRRHGSASSFYPAPPPPPASASAAGSSAGREFREHPHRRDEELRPQPHSHARSRAEDPSLPPFGYPPSSGAVYHASQVHASENSQTRTPTEMELRGELPRAWSPSAGVRRKYLSRYCIRLHTIAHGTF